MDADELKRVIRYAALLQMDEAGKLVSRDEKEDLRMLLRKWLGEQPWDEEAILQRFPHLDKSGK